PASPFLCFLACRRAHRDLHSLPTRRSSDLPRAVSARLGPAASVRLGPAASVRLAVAAAVGLAVSVRLTELARVVGASVVPAVVVDRKSIRLNSSHVKISYAVFCLKTKNWIQ